MKKKISIMLFLITTLVISFLVPQSNVSAEKLEDVKSSKVNSAEEKKWRAEWEKADFDQEVQDIFVEKLSNGELPDSANPEVEPIREESTWVGNTLETKYYYEDGTYEIVTESPVPTALKPASDSVQPFDMNGRLHLKLVQRKNGLVEQSFLAEYYLSTGGNGTGEYIVRVYGKKSASLGGTVASDTLSIIQKRATVASSAKALQSTRVNAKSNGSITYNMYLVIHGGSARVVLD